MLPDRVSNPGPLTYESGALPIALRGPAECIKVKLTKIILDVLKCTCVRFRLSSSSAAILNKTKLVSTFI